MGLVQIGASILISLLIGALTRGTRRTYLLLASSILALYWFQPALPLRSFDFWLPSLSLALMLLTWLITSQTGAHANEGSSTWRSPQNMVGFLIIVGLVTVIELSRYLLPDPIVTATTPPQFFQYFAFIVMLGLVILSITWISRRSIWAISGTIILLIAILVVLKTPVLSLQTSIFFRTLANRPVESASFTDLRWLGFSYIAFRLIHVLRDKQMGRLPELTLPEFATYVVFFPSLAAGPIDRAERFAHDLQREFELTQDETFLAGQRIFLGLFKKFVIADTLALIALNDPLATQVRTAGWMWIIVYAYAFQIYFDFSGYTDIAIGIARLVGVRLPENFAAPYTKPNLTQFWNNWHMTLTQWFRSYFFNPFNRWIRGFKNIPAWTMILTGQIATMLLIGLWHGITLNFVLWGLWHGVGLFLQNRWSEFVRTRYPNLGQNARLQPVLQISGTLLTFHFVALGWVFFALSAPALSWQVFRKLFGM
ncbi:MAG TPA: MBOAT family O-acyltransferase [Anaerolineales bacterium]|nr:MBOAT family O-acyltransferase [Anaerolineales bacterium]